MPAPSLAIDFGTSRTKVAYFDEDRREPRLIEIGREIRAIIPSTFYVPLEGKGERQVGDDAQDRIEIDPQGVVIGLKKEIHRLGKKHFGLGRQSVGRVDLASDLFRSIRRICREEVFHSDVTACTLTVPVTFEEQKRECIRQAAELGGFREIKIVEEPVSAAQAWLVQTGQKFGNHVIVCDVGGGTTDLALLRYAGRRFEQVPEVPTAGFAMGGNDIDESIFDQLLGLQDSEFNHDLAINQKAGFLIKIRKLREMLPRDQRGEFVVSLALEKFRVTRDVLEQSTSEFASRVKDEMRRFLTRCHQVGDLGESPLLLVGGASRLPGLKESLESLAPGQVYIWNQSDYATVLGAVDLPVTKAKQPSKVEPVNAETPATLRVKFSRIREMVGDGQCEQAMEIVARALESNPTDSVFDLWLRVSEATPEASRVLGRARDIHRARQGDVWSTAVLAVALVGMGRLEEAKAAIEPWINDPSFAKDPGCFPTRFAWLETLSNDDPTYPQLLDYLLYLRPNSAILLRYKSETLFETEPTRAHEMLDRAIQLDPYCPYALLMCALVRHETATNHEAAIAAIRADLAVVERIAKTHCVAKVLRAYYWLNTSDFHSARAELNLAIQDPRFADGESTAWILWLRAQSNLALNDSASARRDVDEVLRSAPNFIKAIFLKGEILNQDSKWQDALSFFDRGLRLSPSSCDGLLGRAWALVGLGRNREAAQEFETAAKLYPDNIELIGLATYGAILEKLGGETEKLAELDGYLFIWPNIPAEKLAAAASKLGRVPEGDQTVLLLFDATTLGTLDYGFYVTERHAVFRSEPVMLGFQAGTCELIKIRNVSLKTQNKGIMVEFLNGSSLLPMPDGFLWDGKNMRVTVRLLFEHIAALHRRIKGND